ncbi:hypothetical protein VTI74DRAFT_10922 [Chaetomium olivicolor]
MLRDDGKMMSGAIATATMSHAVTVAAPAARIAGTATATATLAAMAGIATHTAGEIAP